MEKVLYSLWRNPSEDIEGFSRRLRQEMAPELLRIGARGLQLNIRDTEVATAAMMDRKMTNPAMDAIAHVWVDSAVNELRQPFDDVLQKYAHRIAGYLVSESQPLMNTEFPPVLGERTVGLSQVVFMKRPPRLSPEAWMDLWHGDQTRLAVELQNNFFYAQNVVVRPVTYAAPLYDAIVEECLHVEALTDPRFRFRGKTFEEREKNTMAFLENTFKMVDFDKIDVYATSQYVFKHPGVY
ncbi:MAG TPA: hypothetical protein VLC91_14680 [Spongiibacteraceae bacterium]|nr:hypothetical protein [Spongiibacteraceae bacterium]